MSFVYKDHRDSWSKRYDISDDVMKTKRDTGLICTEDVQEILYMLSRIVTRPYDVIMVA